MRILLLIRQLSVGGAERQVCLLAEALRGYRFWLMGAVFGALYFAVLLGVVWPWLEAMPIIRR